MTSSERQPRAATFIFHPTIHSLALPWQPIIPELGIHVHQSDSSTPQPPSIPRPCPPSPSMDRIHRTVHGRAGPVKVHVPPHPWTRKSTDGRCMFIRAHAEKSVFTSFKNEITLSLLNCDSAHHRGCLFRSIEEKRMFGADSDGYNLPLRSDQSRHEKSFVIVTHILHSWHFKLPPNPVTLVQVVDEHILQSIMSAIYSL